MGVGNSYRLFARNEAVFWNDEAYGWSLGVAENGWRYGPTFIVTDSAPAERQAS